MRFARFMARPLGRGLRVVLGLLLILWGFRQGTTVGTAVGIFGLVPLLAGTLNVCVFAPLIGAPFKGRDALR